MAMSDKSWNEIIEVISYKAREMRTPVDPSNIMQIMRDNWELICCHEDCCTYLAEQRLADKIALRDQAIADAAALEAQIQELEVS